MKLIKHRLKYKPAQGLSHPIGAQNLSEYFAGIPMLDEINLVLDGKAGGSIGLFVPGWGLRYLKNRRGRLGFKELAYAGHNSLGWTLRIMAVPREQKHAIRSILLDDGFRIMKAWLSANRPETWYEGNHVLQVGVNENITELYFLETHNEWVVKDQTVTVQR